MKPPAGISGTLTKHARLSQRPDIPRRPSAGTGGGIIPSRAAPVRATAEDIGQSTRVRGSPNPGVSAQPDSIDRQGKDTGFARQRQDFTPNLFQRRDRVTPPPREGSMQDVIFTQPVRQGRPASGRGYIPCAARQKPRPQGQIRRYRPASSPEPCAPWRAPRANRG